MRKKMAKVFIKHLELHMRDAAETYGACAGMKGVIWLN